VYGIDLQQLDQNAFINNNSDCFGNTTSRRSSKYGGYALIANQCGKHKLITFELRERKHTRPPNKLLERLTSIWYKCTYTKRYKILKHIRKIQELSDTNTETASDIQYYQRTGTLPTHAKVDFYHVLLWPTENK